MVVVGGVVVCVVGVVGCAVVEYVAFVDVGDVVVCVVGVVVGSAVVEDDRSSIPSDVGGVVV